MLYNDLDKRYKCVNMNNGDIYGILCTKRKESSKYEIFIPYIQIAHALSYTVHKAIIEEVLSLYTNWTDVEYWVRWDGLFISFNHTTDLSPYFGMMVHIYITVEF